ncbi:MAG TPA: NAD-dependent epimerase/dehydratase family protein [Edaphocola sp.]|nr:NAD-dependent epimerase/dehydratase family protein [Edaphocola sp.]
MIIGVTGANGHIGFSVCQTLVEHHYNVLGFVRQTTPYLEDLGISLFIGNLNNENDLEGFVKSCNVIIHAAGKIDLAYKFSQELYEINVKATERLLNFALQYKIEKFIHFSSIQAFLQNKIHKTIDENSPFCSDKALYYDQTKRDGFLMVLEAAHLGLNVIILCPTAVIGVPDYKISKIGKSVIEIYNKVFPAVVNGGFNFVDVRDVAQAAVKALESPKSGEVYILGGKYYSLNKFSEIILHEKGETKGLKSIPILYAYWGLPIVKFLAWLFKKKPIYDSTYLDILNTGNKNISHQKASHDLDYHPRPLEETLHDMVVWLKKTEMIK